MCLFATNFSVVIENIAWRIGKSISQRTCFMLGVFFCHPHFYGRIDCFHHKRGDERTNVGVLAGVVKAMSPRLQSSNKYTFIVIRCGKDDGVVNYRDMGSLGWENCFVSCFHLLENGFGLRILPFRDWHTKGGRLLICPNLHSTLFFDVERSTFVRHYDFREPRPQPDKNH